MLESSKSTIKYNANPALKGDQTKLPDALQKGIIDKSLDEDDTAHEAQYANDQGDKGDKMSSINLEEHCGCENKEEADPLFRDYIGTTRALQLWFHAAHHVTRGAGFVGDHIHLYGDLYTKIEEDIDVIIEKAISILEDEMIACPVSITSYAAEILKEYPSPSGHTALGIAASGKTLLGGYLEYLEFLRDALKEAGALTLGLEDHIASTANSYESFLYMLQQREKSELQN